MKILLADIRRWFTFRVKNNIAIIDFTNKFNFIKKIKLWKH